MFVYELSGCGFESSCSHLRAFNIAEDSFQAIYQIEYVKQLHWISKLKHNNANLILSVWHLFYTPLANYRANLAEVGIPRDLNNYMTRWDINAATGINT